MGSAFASSTRQLEEKVRVQALVGDSDRWRPRRSGIDCVVVFCHPLWSIPQDAYLVSHSTEHTASYVVDGSKETAENRTVGTGKNQNPESNLDFVASLSREFAAVQFLCPPMSQVFCSRGCRGLRER